jgi:hypothetical protein
MGAHRSARPGRARADGGVRHTALTARGLFLGLVMLADSRPVSASRARRSRPVQTTGHRPRERVMEARSPAPAPSPASFRRCRGPIEHPGTTAVPQALRRAGAVATAATARFARSCRHRQVGGADPDWRILEHVSTSVNSACLHGPSRAAPVASPKVWVPDAKINPCRDRPPCSSSASRPPGLRYRLGRAIHELDRVHEAS